MPWSFLRNLLSRLGPRPKLLHIARAPDAAVLAQALKIAAPAHRTAYLPRVDAHANPAAPLASRFGGRPALRAGERWPTCACGVPMPLFLQLRSADLPPNEPAFDGLLQLFVSTNDCTCSSWEPFGPGSLPRIIPLTDDLRLPDDGPAFPPAAITGWDATPDRPDPQELREMNLGLTDAQLDALVEADDGHPLEGDKLLGAPRWIQGIEYPSCPTCGQRMRLLFQLDSECNVPHMFGDSGIGYLTACPSHPHTLAFGWSCH